MKAYRMLAITSLALLALGERESNPISGINSTTPFQVIAGEPPLPPGELPLNLVVYNNNQANFFLDNPQWVHPGDKFMIVSANAFGGDYEGYNPDFVNDTARRLLERFP